MRRKTVITGFAIAAASLLAAPMLPASAAPVGDGDINPMIVGGHDATEEYSWMVSMQSGGQHSCGGSLIKPDWVLTAAHCVEGKQPEDLTLRIGSKDNTTGGTEVGVAELIGHEGHDGSGPNDIALMKLANPVDNAPIELAAEAGQPEPSRIIGWGSTQPDGSDSPKILQELDTKVVEPAGCQDGGIDADTELCTDSDTPDANACFGDSGGPQLKGGEGNWKLIGVTSRLGGASGECAVDPSIYTNAVAHNDWINEHINS